MALEGHRQGENLKQPCAHEHLFFEAIPRNNTAAFEKWKKKIKKLLSTLHYATIFTKTNWKHLGVIVFRNINNALSRHPNNPNNTSYDAIPIFINKLISYFVKPFKKN